MLILDFHYSESLIDDGEKNLGSVWTKKKVGSIQYFLKRLSFVQYSPNDKN